MKSKNRLEKSFIKPRKTSITIGEKKSKLDKIQFPVTVFTLVFITYLLPVSSTFQFLLSNF